MLCLAVYLDLFDDIGLLTYHPSSRPVEVCMLAPNRCPPRALPDVSVRATGLDGQSRGAFFPCKGIANFCAFFYALGDDDIDTSTGHL